MDKKEMNELLKRATDEVGKRPDWMKSDDVKAQLEKIVAREHEPPTPSK